MHEYTSNKSHRKTIIAIITLLSLLINGLMAPVWEMASSWLNSSLGQRFYPFILLLGIGFSTVFGVLYLLFDHFIWKIIPGMRKQNISGEYTCLGKSSYGNHAWEGSVTIKQTWSHIVICLETKSSCSKSYMANIKVDELGTVRLNYNYYNTPNGTDEGLYKHEGTAEFCSEKGNVIGKYYNYPVDRPQHGTMKLQKKEK